MKCYRIAVFLLLFFSHNLTFGQTADLTEGCATFEVNFTPPAGSTSFFWDFGDGASSPDMSPAHNYTAPGTYEVIFSESINGPQVGQSITINVYAVPTISLVPDPAGGCAPLTTTITANITANAAIQFTNYTWDFGDTESESGPGLNEVTHVYNNAGSFNVAMQWETNFTSCNSIIIEPALITPAGPPNITFGTNPALPFSCTAPFEVTFINPNQNSNLTWAWDFGDGNSSTDASPTHTFTTTGNFTVTLVGTDDVGCSGTFSSVVNVGEPLASFDLAEDTVCVGSTQITMMNTSSIGPNVTYAWTFDNGTFPTTSAQFNPIVNFAPGVTNITLVVTDTDGAGNQCSSTVTGELFVDDPDATFVSIPTYSCTNILDAQFVPNNTNAAQYLWTFSDFQDNGGTSEDMSPNWTYVNKDTTTYGINGLLEYVTSLTVVSEAGCVATFTQTDTIHEPNALFFPDVVEGCAPLTVNFENRSTNDFDIVAFNWEWGDGSNDLVNTDDDQTHTFTMPGEYEVVLSLTDELGCQDTSWIQIIEVGGPITPDFTLSSTQICPGDSITMTDITNSDLIDGWHFSTDANRSFHCFSENTLTHTFESGTGFFDVTLEVEYNGCYSEVTQTNAIEVQGPIAHIDYLVDCDDPFNIEFRDSSDDATSILWEFGDFTDTTVNNPFHEYADTGIYTVYLTASNNLTGCADSRDSVIVNVRDIEAHFDLDSFLCLGLEYDLDAILSEDVNADCHRGYTWFFSDPNDRPITTQNPSVGHAFEQRDTNFITLVTTDINGCTDTIIDTVRVFGVYPELMAMPTPICIPGTVEFSSLGTDADTTIDNYMWDFGDGNTSEDINPIHTYTTAPPNGTSFNVTLNVEDVIPCSNIGTLEVPVYVPVSTISATPSLNICVGDAITFTASDFMEQGSSLEWDWDFGMFGTGTGQTQTITYTSAGTFQVTLNYNEIGSDCPGVPDIVTVNVQDYPDAMFTTSVDGQEFVCAGQIITFNDATNSPDPLSVLWDFGDASATGAGAMVTHTYTSGTFTITQTVTTSNGCSDTSMREINLFEPLGDLDFTTNDICYGDEITFTLVDTMDVESWTIDFGDGTVVDNQGVVTHAYNDPLLNNTTIVKLILRAPGGLCEKVVDITVTLDAIDVNFSNFIPSGCVDNEIQFGSNAPEANMVMWDFGDGTTSTDLNPTHIYTEPGDYFVVLEGENALGCVALAGDSISIGIVPEMVALDQAECSEDIATLSVETGDDTEISWTPANVLTNPDSVVTMTNVPVGQLGALINNFVVSGQSPQSDMCVATDTVVVYNVPPLEIPVDFNPTVCTEQRFVLPITNPGNFYKINWSVSSVSGNDVTSLVELPCEACDTFAVEILRGFTASDTIILTGKPEVTILPEGNPICSPEFELKIAVLGGEIPNAFTPDGDSRNDFFAIPVDGLYQIETFEIYNRWGNKVYDNDTPATGWDGNFNGNPAPSDVYIFIFQTTNNECVFRGNVTLIR